MANKQNFPVNSLSLLLTGKEYTDFLSNVAYSSRSEADIQIHLMPKQHIRSSPLISCLFNWKESPQGDRYWSDMYNAVAYIEDTVIHRDLSGLTNAKIYKR